MGLESIAAETALELSLADRQNDLSEASLKGQTTASGISSGGAMKSKRLRTSTRSAVANCTGTVSGGATRAT